MIYPDALVVKIRDGAHVSNRSAHMAVGVDLDVLIVCCDGLNGFPEAIEATGRG